MGHQKQLAADARRGGRDKIYLELPAICPGLVRFLDEEADFRGFFISVGREGGFLAGAKRYGTDGTPEILFCSSYGLLECLVGIDKALQTGQWRVDKWKPPS